MIRPVLTAMIVGVLVSGAMAAQIPNGGFESGGLPSNWTTAGNVRIVSSVGDQPGSAVVNPYEGRSFAAVSTRGIGNNAVPAGSSPFAFFTGNPAGIVGGGGSGQLEQYAGVSFSVTVTSLSFVSAMINIVTGADILGTFDDIVAVYVQQGSGPVTPATGWVIGPTSTPASPFSGLTLSNFSGAYIGDNSLGFFPYGQTGWFLMGGDVPSAGTYTFYVLAGDFGDRGGEVGFFLDDIRTQAVPEPGTWILFGAGVLGLAGWRRFRKRAK